MIKKTNLMVVATLIFLTAVTTGCGQDRDIHGKKLPKDHPFRSGKIVGIVDDTQFNWHDSVGIGLSVRDDNQLTTIVMLNHKPDREKIYEPYKNDKPYQQHMAGEEKKYQDLKMAFKSKYHSTRVECEIKDFLLAPESEKEPGVLGAIFGSCEQKGESIEDWLLSESMVTEVDSVEVVLNPPRTTPKKPDPFFVDKLERIVPKDHPWRSNKIAGTVDEIAVLGTVIASVRNNITGDITTVFLDRNIELNHTDPDWSSVRNKIDESLNNKYKGKKIKCDITAVDSVNLFLAAKKMLGSVDGACEPGVNEWVEKEIDRILSERNVSGGGGLTL